MAQVNRVPGYSGICRECFCPIRTGEEKQFRQGGPLFHSKCVEQHSDGYYIKQERRKAARQAKKAHLPELAGIGSGQKATAEAEYQYDYHISSASDCQQN